MTNQIKILSGGDKEIIQRLFGRTIEECIEALELLDASRKENKMTREEAKNKLDARFRLCASDVDIFIDGLEALGLLKFEEENFVNVNGTSIPYKLYLEHHMAINALIANGFRFIKA